MSGRTSLRLRPDFTMDVIPAIPVRVSGSDAVFAVNVGSVHGFSDAVTLSAMSAPPGAAVSFSPIRCRQAAAAR